MSFISEEQAAAIAASAPSRQVRRELMRRVDKHNRHIRWEQELTVRKHRAATNVGRRMEFGTAYRERQVAYPAGEDQRHDKYLHAFARRGRALRSALSARK